MGMFAVASIHLMALEATETAAESNVGSLLPKNIDLRLLFTGRWWVVTILTITT